jgi:hypothetical protein
LRTIRSSIGMICATGRPAPEHQWGGERDLRRSGGGAPVTAGH